MMRNFSSDSTPPCRATDLPFFPPDLVGDGSDPNERRQHSEEESWYRGEEAEKAKEVCSTCQFKEDCLREGMKEDHGVYGGTTPEERVALKKRPLLTEDGFLR